MGALAGLAVLAGLAGQFPEKGLRAFLPLWILLGWGVAVYGLLGHAQSPLYTFREVGRYGALLLAGAYAFELLHNARWRAGIFAAIIVSAVLVGVLGIAQYLNLLARWFPVFPGYDQQVYSVFGNQDLFGGYVALGIALVVPAFLSSSPPGGRGLRDGLYAVAFVVLCPALLISASRSAWLAAAIGVSVSLPYKTLARKRSVTVAAAALILVLAVCVAAPGPTFDRATGTFGEEDVGWRARLWFWDATVRMIGDAPVLGRGPGNFQYWSPYYQGAALHAQGGERHYHNELHTLHAHSDPLELFAETGVVGALCAAWMLIRLLGCRGREWGGLAALLAFSVFNATFQSAAHGLCAVLLCGALLCGRQERQPEASGAKPYLVIGVAVAAFALIALCVSTVLIPSFGYRAAEAAHEAQRPSEALYERAAGYWWPEAEALEEWGAIEMDRGNFEAAEGALSRARRRLDTGRIHYLLGVLAAERGDSDAARRAFEACRWRWPSKPAAWWGLLDVSSRAEGASLKAEAARWLSSEEVAGLLE